ncbi:MAG: hypothetical protein ACLR23_10590 [Clostridia bacterium]
MKIDEKMKEGITLQLEKEPRRQKAFLVFTVDKILEKEVMLEPDDKIINGYIDACGGMDMQREDGCQRCDSR